MKKPKGRIRNLPRKLRALAARHGLTSQALGKIGGRSGATAHGWLHGTVTPCLESAARLACYFSVSLDSLALDEIDDPGPCTTLTPDQKLILDTVEVLGLGTAEALARLGGGQKRPS